MRDINEIKSVIDLMCFTVSYSRNSYALSLFLLKAFHRRYPSLVCHKIKVENRDKDVGLFKLICLLSKQT